MMFACYRREDAADAVTMLDAVAAVLADYPDAVIHAVTDPRRGLPSRSKFPPNVAEVKEACEAEMEPIRRANEREARYRETQRILDEGSKRTGPAPTMAELRDRYGENWGLKTLKQERRKANAQRLPEANRLHLERECAQRGVPVPGPLEPSPLLLEAMARKLSAPEAAE